MAKNIELTGPFCFHFGSKAGLQKFEGISSLDDQSSTIALRVLKFHFEEYLGVEISDRMFTEIFNEICNIKARRGKYGHFYYDISYQLGQILERNCLPWDLWWEIENFFRLTDYDGDIVKRHYKKILLHIPHSSSVFPKYSEYSFSDLDVEERLLIDYYTDELFLPQNGMNNISSVVFPYCRLFCDVERLLNDPLEKYGLGISYSRFTGPEPFNIRSFGKWEDAYAEYIGYHAMVTNLIVRLKPFLDPLLLVDCHSFSSHPTLLCNKPSNDVDICIGFNEDETKPYKVVIGNIEQYFKSLGYKVGINTPFSNSKTFPESYDYHSIMIEVNKRLYMDESTLEKTEGFAKLHGEIQSLYKILLTHR